MTTKKPTGATTRTRGAGVRLRGEGWTVYDHVDGGYELAFYVAGKRRKARVPAVYTTDAQLTTFAVTTIRAVTDESKRVAEAAPAAPTRPTFRSFAERWTSGELARQHPDHVKVKRTSGDDAQRLATHVYPHVENVALEDFTLDDAERVMRKLPATMAAATRRQVAQLIHRVLKLATYPARLIPANPLPVGFLPKPGKSKAHGYLYPSEDAKLLGHKPTPLGMRLLFGFLAREGMRASEACGLLWSDVDLVHGAVTLDENKTDDPRTWTLDRGVVEALAIWREIAPKPRDKHGKLRDDVDAKDLPVFVDADGAPFDPAKTKLADRLRTELRAAGVDRSQLFETTAQRAQLRAHDLRATFVTLALAAGKSEAWVCDRTGHRSSQMVNRYRRAARSVAELGLGALRPLVAALPELAALRPKAAAPRARREGPTRRRRRTLSARRRRPVVSALVSRDRMPRQPNTDPLVFSVGPVGNDPTTNGLKVRCSTD